jgi:hypothetical protein
MELKIENLHVPVVHNLAFSHLFLCSRLSHLMNAFEDSIQKARVKMLKKDLKCKLQKPFVGRKLNYLPFY